MSIFSFGASGIDFYPEKVYIYFDGEKIVNKGCAGNFNIKRIKRILRKKEINVEVCLNMGKHDVTVLTSDLSYEYVKINSLYS